MRQALAVVAPLLQAVAVVLLARVPALERVLPILGVFRGPIAFVLLALGAAVTLSRWRPLPRGVTTPRPLLLFVLAVAFSLALGVPYVRQVQASGDEVEYLLMAQSLWREHDLDLRDNFERGDHLEYVPGLPRLPFGTLRADGRPISSHSVGLALLLAPVYALGGRLACVVLLALVAAGLGLEVRALALRAGADHRSAAFALAAAVGPPVVFYSFFVYTEVVSAFALALGLRLLLSTSGARGAAGAALALSLLPWLHVKMIPAAVALGGFALWRLRGRNRMAFAAVAAAMAIVFMAYYWIVFGQPTPLVLYGSRSPRALERMSPGLALPGTFLDAAFGLLPHAPVYLLALAGLPWLLRRGVRDAAPYGLVLVAILVPVVTWRNWWGGFCPPGRLLVPLVPVLGVALALRVSGEPRGLARWRWPLLAGGLALAAYMTAEPRETMLLNGRDQPPRVWEALAGSVSPGRYLPHLSSRLGSTEPPWRPPEAETRVALLWVAALGVLLALDRLARRRGDVDRWFRGLALPLAALMLLSAGVDRWARADESRPLSQLAWTGRPVRITTRPPSVLSQALSSTGESTSLVARGHPWAPTARAPTRACLTPSS